MHTSQIFPQCCYMHVTRKASTTGLMRSGINFFILYFVNKIKGQYKMRIMIPTVYVTTYYYSEQCRKSNRSLFFTMRYKTNKSILIVSDSTKKCLPTSKLHCCFVVVWNQVRSGVEWICLYECSATKNCLHHARHKNNTFTVCYADFFYVVRYFSLIL